VALLLFFLATAPVLHRADLPPVWGLLLGILLVLAPIELGVVLFFARRHGDVPLRQALGLQPIRRGDLGPLLLTAALSALAPGLVIWLEPVLQAALFAWLPDWFGASPGDLSTYSPTVTATTFALWLLSAVLVGPAVEEIYFRGWLLPRLPGGHLTGSTVNAALFSCYHLWQPYALLTVFLFSLPLAVLVRRRRNPSLSITVHCTVNLLAFVALLTGALHR
jgi:membrane protease YdiL (CAAX protease family)